VQLKEKGQPYRPAFLNFLNATSLLALFSRAGRFALLAFFVLYFRFFLGGRGRILCENGGTGEKGKAEGGSCDGLHFDLSPKISEPVICYCSITRFPHEREELLNWRLKSLHDDAERYPYALVPRRAVSQISPQASHPVKAVPALQCDGIQSLEIAFAADSFAGAPLCSECGGLGSED
jgi:hypothetical protein